MKAYYAALIKKQQELDEASRKQQELSITNTFNDIEPSSSRHVGMKFKREEDEGDEDVDWEETNTLGEFYNNLPQIQTTLCLLELNKHVLVIFHD